MKIQKLNRKQAYQTLYLLRFNFTLKHILGTKIERADKLSRRSDWKVETENDNSNQILIKEQQIYNLVKVVIDRPKVDIVEKIKKDQGQGKIKRQQSSRKNKESESQSN